MEKKRVMLNLNCEELEIIEWTNHDDWDRLIRNHEGNRNYYFKNKSFRFKPIIEPGAKIYQFKNCCFEKGIVFAVGQSSTEGVKANIFNQPIIIENCWFKNPLDYTNPASQVKKNIAFDVSKAEFNKKFRLHNSTIESSSFSNTKFNALADFWKTTFENCTIFYKTDFNDTVVFSMATFKKNVLFTYTLFNKPAIFSRTKFNKGVDFSQAIIANELKLFDLKFNKVNFDAEFVGENDVRYQNFIDGSHRKNGDCEIPLVNKVHTFQILKNQFEQDGNYADAVIMRREEKKTLKKLTTFRRKDNNANWGDSLILWFNRWSNHFKSDFRNGIWFTLASVVIFGGLTLFFTEDFERVSKLIQFQPEDENLLKGIKFFFTFLNPARGLDYLSEFELKCFGISYVFDFLGRIAVGYGIYQTVQAFRKFR